MGFGSLWHWLIVLAIVVLVFGTSKLPKAMGDFAKGIKAFKSGMKDEEAEAMAAAPPQVSPPTASPSTAGDRTVHDRG
jgi:sec-independent protein translocase protein TatA